MKNSNHLTKLLILVLRFVSIAFIFLTITASHAEDKKTATTAVEQVSISAVEFNVDDSAKIFIPANSMANAVLNSFNPEKYTIIEAGYLKDILSRHKLNIAELAQKPELLNRTTIKEVNQIILGSISLRMEGPFKKKYLDISTLIYDIKKGSEISRAKCSVLQRQSIILTPLLKELAKIIQMGNHQRAKYLDEDIYKNINEEIWELAKYKKFEQAISAFCHAICIKPTDYYENDLDTLLRKKIEWEKIDCDKQTRHLVGLHYLDEAKLLPEDAHLKKINLLRLAYKNMAIADEILSAIRSLESELKKLKHKMTEDMKRPEPLEFISHMAKANAYLKELPILIPRSLKPSQKILLDDAENHIDAAINIKPSDSNARAIKKHIERYRTGMKTLCLDLGNGINLCLLELPAGKCIIGSPTTEIGRDRNSEVIQREMDIQKPFYIGVYEITQEQYQAVMKNNFSKFKWHGTDAPAENVSWNMAMEFCEKLSEKTGFAVTLPTEYQWEYACRAGSTSAYSWGNSWEPGKCNIENQTQSRTDHSIEEFCKRGLNIDGTIPVGRFEPNGYGLYDMHGNVAEWCLNEPVLHIKVSGNRYFRSGYTSDRRILRGGHWQTSPAYARSAHRYRSNNISTQAHTGFRIVINSTDAEINSIERTRRKAFSTHISNARKALKKLPPVMPVKLNIKQHQLLIDANNNLNAAAFIFPMNRRLADAIQELDDYMFSSDSMVIDISDRVSLKLVKIPAGSFMMGSPKEELSRDNNEGPQREVTITKPFYMGIYELTREQYYASGLAGQKIIPSEDKEIPLLLSWHGATKYCKYLSEKTGYNITLPTEAQWEYACRGNHSGLYGFDQNVGKLEDYAWYVDNSGGRLHPVGQKQPNCYGLYDMHGNASEWCLDVYFEDAYSQNGYIDLPFVLGNYESVVRGGAYYSPSLFCRSAKRFRCSQGRAESIGLRIIAKQRDVLPHER